jgi:hypothetical protein
MERLFLIATMMLFPSVAFAHGDGIFVAVFGIPLSIASLIIAVFPIVRLSRALLDTAFAVFMVIVSISLYAVWYYGGLMIWQNFGSWFKYDELVYLFGGPILIPGCIIAFLYSLIRMKKKIDVPPGT